MDVLKMKVLKIMALKAGCKAISNLTDKNFHQKA